MMELDHGAAIVTGAAGGIGRVIAERLAAAGMAVVLADLDGPRLDATRAALDVAAPGARLVTVQGDVGEPAHHDELVATAEQIGSGDGGLRLSVLNAGVSLPGLSWELPIEHWELTTRVNYWGVVHGMRAALSVMVPASEGWVVGVSSGAGLVSPPGIAAYSATKHAVVAMMESTHHELSRIGSPVGASVVCPGSIRTDMPYREPPGGPGATDGSHYAEVTRELVAATREGVRCGADPMTVVDALVAGVCEGRFWILPQPELAWAATDRSRRIVEGGEPVDLLG